MNSRISYLFDKGIQILLAFLPWTTFVSVFLVYKLHIPGANFIKEILLFALIGLLGILLFQKYKNQKFSCKNFFKKHWLFVLIVFYILSMSVVTIFTTGIRGLIFGGRYDFVFLVIFLVAYYGQQFLSHSIGYYLQIFIVSAGIMLFVSGLLKFPLSEEILLFFGYSQHASMWDFGGAPPIFHGIDGAGVRRFQGLLDGPNTMGAFLIIFTGILLYYARHHKEWYFVLGVIVFGVILMIIYTYSRSATIAFIGAGIVALAGGIKILYAKYKKQMLAILGVIIFLVWAISLKYSGSSESIIGREDSTKGHAERMLVGVERFLEKPLGQGLGSAGPAYRHVLKLQDFDRSHVEEQDRFYIPESWYIQQYIEGGFLGGTLFLIIMASIFFLLWFMNSILGGMFAGIGVMNLFLHTFESSVVSWSLFLLIGLLLAYEKHRKSKKV